MLSSIKRRSVPYMVFGAAIVAVLALTGLVPAASASNSISGLAVTGVLTNASGQPTAGYVQLQADPSPLPSSWSPTLVTSVVPTGTDGSYSFSENDLINSPAATLLQRYAANNGGWVNFHVVGETPNDVGGYYFSRQLTGSGWSAGYNGTTANVVAAHALSATAKANYPANANSPKDPAPQCITRTLRTRAKWMLVGETHRWPGSRARYHYGKHADSHVEIKVNVAAGWQSEGSAHIGDSSSSGIGFNLRDTAPANGRGFKSKFLMAKTSTRWNGVGICDQGLHVRARNWIGGLVQGPRWGGTMDGICNTLRYRYRTVVGAPGGLERNTMHNRTYGQAVKVFGVSLSAYSGLSTFSSYYYRFHRREFICGNNGHTRPVNAAIIAVGPRA